MEAKSKAPRLAVSTPRNSRNPPAFAGKSVPQEKSRAVFR
ncbi:hypothetical protein SpAn4DRAFT_4059 [Sporomusa ovata]|uniref:Uncharacterized protein n=1 Tax=Sporomusa ovata TaxID=2378 RepID=A0A0U1KY12_9FIRM|nr:hypothetical protein SpAn4DRAFT_4059 [Sporomusa ovata]